VKEEIHPEVDEIYENTRFSDGCCFSCDYFSGVSGQSVIINEIGVFECVDVGMVFEKTWKTVKERETKH